MFQVDNFISFHDLTPEGHFLWASSSITACLGYEPEEIVDTPAYAVIHPDDIAYVKVTHQENVLNEMVGTQIVLRFMHKDGSWVPCMVIFSLCYDYIVTCSTEFARIKRHHQAFEANTWNPNGLDPEPRACMILNRFSRNLGIMYASPSCQIIFGIQPDQIVGKPFLLFIRADDLAAFVEQVDMAKASNVVTHMRFWFQSPSHQQEIPCEAMLFGAADGMIAILRKCKPFFRKQLIAQTSAWDQDIDTQSYRHRVQDHGVQSQSWWSSEFDHRDRSWSITSSPTISPNSTSSIPSDSPSFSSCSETYSHYSSSQSSSTGVGTPGYMHRYQQHSRLFQQNSTGSYTLRGVPIGSINSIRNLDKEHNRIRPLTSLHSGNESSLEDGTKPLPPGYKMRMHHIQVLDEEDNDEDEDGASTLERDFAKMVDI
ncbi:hypothetical protein BG004_005782 [Podila humilis]|nr:hypothetical protein BG004_005782 [Podila humilis]